MDDGHPIIRIVIFIILLLIDAAFTGIDADGTGELWLCLTVIVGSGIGLQLRSLVLRIVRVVLSLSGLDFRALVQLS